MGFLLPFVAAETSVTGRCVKRLASWQRGPGSRNDRDDLIAINGDHGDPTPMYQAHRRGWVEPNEFFLRPGQLDRLRMKGCRYIVILKEFSGDLDLALKKVYDSEQFKVYKIRARES